MVWIYRCALLLMSSAIIYIALLPEFDFSKWVPNALLAQYGVPPQSLVWLNDEVDKVAHALGAFLVSCLLFLSRAGAYKEKYASFIALSFFALAMFAVAVEFAQLEIGRQFSISDIVAGMIGITAGSLTVLCLSWFSKPAERQVQTDKSNRAENRSSKLKTQHKPQRAQRASKRKSKIFEPCYIQQG